MVPKKVHRFIYFHSGSTVLIGNQERFNPRKSDSELQLRADREFALSCYWAKCNERAEREAKRVLLKNKKI